LDAPQARLIRPPLGSNKVRQGWGWWRDRRAEPDREAEIPQAH
jgi:hypothetical protein